MEIIVKIIHAYELEMGTSKSGTQWAKRCFVGETLEQYSKQLYFTLFNKNVDICPAEGSIVKVYFDVNSRMWSSTATGKSGWATDLMAYRVEQQQYTQPHTPAYPQQQYTQPTQLPTPPQVVDNIPF